VAERTGRVSVDALTKAMFWYEVVRRRDDGKLLTLTEACEKAGITPAGFAYHKRKRTDKWRRASAAVNGLIGDEELRNEARRRAMELLRHGADAPAGSLITKLLDLSERKEISGEGGGPVRVVIEQFGEDDHGGGNQDGTGRRAARD